MKNVGWILIAILLITACGREDVRFNTVNNPVETVDVPNEPNEETEDSIEEEEENDRIPQSLSYDCTDVLGSLASEEYYE